MPNVIRPAIDSDAEKARADFGSYTREQYFEDLAKVTDYRVQGDMADLLVDGSRETMRWLKSQGARFLPLYEWQFKLPDGRGAIIAGVLRGGPADKAGIKPGDVLREIGGKPVSDPTGMLNMVAALVPGTDARLRLLRKGDEVDVSVQVGKRPKPPPRVESNP